MQRPGDKIGRWARSKQIGYRLNPTSDQGDRSGFQRQIDHHQLLLPTYLQLPQQGYQGILHQEIFTALEQKLEIKRCHQFETHYQPGYPPSEIQKTHHLWNQHQLLLPLLNFPLLHPCGPSTLLLLSKPQGHCPWYAIGQNHQRSGFWSVLHQLDILCALGAGSQPDHPGEDKGEVQLPGQNRPGTLTVQRCKIVPEGILPAGKVDILLR